MTSVIYHFNSTKTGIVHKYHNHGLVPCTSKQRRYYSTNPSVPKVEITKETLDSLGSQVDKDRDSTLAYGTVTAQMVCETEG